MLMALFPDPLTMVALRKESVDRNASSGVDFAEDWLSLSARRAWIEMSLIVFIFLIITVALRKESVDRNFLWLILWATL